MHLFITSNELHSIDTDIRRVRNESAKMLSGGQTSQKKVMGQSWEFSENNSKLSVLEDPQEYPLRWQHLCRFSADDRILSLVENPQGCPPFNQWLLGGHNQDNIRKRCNDSWTKNQGLNSRLKTAELKKILVFLVYLWHSRFLANHCIFWWKMIIVWRRSDGRVFNNTY